MERNSGREWTVEGWHVDRATPPCEVSFTYRSAEERVQLRYRVDPGMGQVTPLDQRTAATSGF